MPKRIDIAVLITCHNRKLKTLACLNALFNQNKLRFNFEFEVFLVDDGSTDGTSEAVRIQFPEVNIIQGDGNLYWNKGMHLSWKTASAGRDFDYYLWLNDDTYLLKNAINQMLSYINSSEVIICGAIRSGIMKQVTYGGYKGDNLIIPNGTFQKIQYFNGNCVLIPKKVFTKVGNLDSWFRHGLGDFDYGLRAAKLEIQSYLSPCFVGICEVHEKLPVWKNSSYSLVVRLKSLYGPLSSCSPIDYFFFEKRHKGFFIAILKIFLTHFQVLMPSYYCNIKFYLLKNGSSKHT